MKNAHILLNSSLRISRRLWKYKALLLNTIPINFNLEASLRMLGYCTPQNSQVLAMNLGEIRWLELRLNSQLIWLSTQILKLIQICLCLLWTVTRIRILAQILNHLNWNSSRTRLIVMMIMKGEMVVSVEERVHNHQLQTQRGAPWKVIMGITIQVQMVLWMGTVHRIWVDFRFLTPCSIHHSPDLRRKSCWTLWIHHLILIDITHLYFVLL